jgi:hypothetical protein
VAVAGTEVAAVTGISTVGAALMTAGVSEGDAVSLISTVGVEVVDERGMEQANIDNPITTMPAKIKIRFDMLSSDYFVAWIPQELLEHKFHNIVA